MTNILRGKFRDKLRKYIKDRYKKKENITIKDKKNITEIIEKEKIKEFKNNPLNVYNKQIKKKEKNKKHGINYSNQKNNVNLKKENNNYKSNGISKISEDKIFEINKVESIILNKINDVVTYYKNKLEIIDSDIYVINTLLKDKKDKENCEKERICIQEIISRLQKIKDEYEVLKSDNINNKYLELNNNILVDDIYNYKKMLDDIFPLNKLQDKYKKLELFLEVSVVIDNVSKEIEKLEEENKEKLEKLCIEELELEKLKNDMFYIDIEKEDYDKYIENSNKIIEDLSNKIDFIDSKEETMYKLNGMNGLLANNLKYISLLMLSPLKGIFPSIATSIIVTKQTLDAIKDSVELKKSTKIIYMAEDYDTYLNDNLYTVYNMKEMVNTSLDDILNIKNQLILKCSSLESGKLKEILNKLDKIEDSLKDNMIKLKLMDKNLNNYKNINKDKMKKIKRLNDKY